MIEKSTKEILFVIITLCSISLQAFGQMMSFDTYQMLDQGMSEGEIVYRAGSPDKEIYFDDPGRRFSESIKQYFYIPLPGDQNPQLTIITFKKGVVITIKRVDVLARVGFPDKETDVGIEQETGDTFVLIRQLTYIPAPQEKDSHLTVITIKKGKATSID